MNDPANFVALMQEFRAQLDAYQPGLLLTIAAGAGEDKISPIDWSAVAPSLDFINLMTYDFFGAWAATGPAAMHSALYSWPEIPGGEPQAPTSNYYSDFAVDAFVAAGVPVNKLVLGVPFYGRGWTGVTNINNGLGQAATQAAPGTYEPGIEDYKVLKNAAGTKFYLAGTMYKYNGNTWWSYDDRTSMATKCAYIQAKGMGGAMFWELTGDTSDGELISVLQNCDANAATLVPTTSSSATSTSSIATLSAEVAVVVAVCAVVALVVLRQVRARRAQAALANETTSSAEPVSEVSLTGLHQEYEQAE